MTRTMLVLAVVLVPGGLLLLAAWALAHAVATRMHQEEGSSGRRLARALSTVRPADVWRHTQASVRAYGQLK